eukprot:scaffold46937_cov19-Tisochrysis_lutea.AAC.1
MPACLVCSQHVLELAGSSGYCCCQGCPTDFLLLFAQQQAAASAAAKVISMLSCLAFFSCAHLQAATAVAAAAA